MAAAPRAASPGGALLRASRMFSIPKPLPRPAPELSGKAVFESNTATLPHPTHLTITTPPSSLSRGDWGLKRPLPLRSTTKSSTPLLRIETMDTFEHTTEFRSAADHSLNLLKFQELNLPLSTPASGDKSYDGRPTGVGRGVFEADIDNLAEEKSGMVAEENRWKFKGPWLAGQTDGEFNAYVSKEIKRRKPEFRKFLRETLATAESNKARVKASEAAEPAPRILTAAEITEDQLRQYLRELRQDRTELFKLIREFLDLAPSPPVSITDEFEDNLYSTGTYNPSESTPSGNPYAEKGPPNTHPSAGLSYLRTNSHIYNHPVFGPQASKPPVEGRVIMPKNAAVGSFAPKLGVAGVVVDIPSGQESYNFTIQLGNKRGAGRAALPGLVSIEPDKVGGSKVWLRPEGASIDSKGHIIMKVGVAQTAAVAVHEGKIDDMDVASAPSKPIFQPLPRPGGQYGLSSRNNGSSEFKADGMKRKEVEHSSALEELKKLLNTSGN